MTGKLPALLLFAPSLLLARDAAGPARTKREIPVASLLPPGSLLSGVMLPRYDENRCLVGVLRAKCMTLVTSEILDGETVSIELFNPDRSPRGWMDLTKARFDQTQGTLHAKETVTLSFDNISAVGSGLNYEMDQAEGFLMGPTTTCIKAPPQTTMNPSSPRRVAVVLGASLAALPLATAPAQVAVPPPEITASAAQTAADANTEARADLRAALSASTQATRAATSFLEQEDLLAKAAPPAAAPVVLQARPLEVKPGPEDTVINCDGGMYFDSDKGLLVYLKNVTVADPRFSLDGANEIQVFFEKKPENPKPEVKPGDKPVPGGLNVKIGDAERIVATGAVHILQKPDANNEAVEGAGAIFTYNVKTGEIILSGGKPWVRKGGIITRAKQSNQTLRVIEGKFTFSDGGTETILPVEQTKRKAK